MQFKRSSRETERQVKQHEAQNLNRLSSIKPRLKKSFFKKKKTTTIFCFFAVNTK